MFKTTAQDGLARCGQLLSKSGPLSTPTAMLYTRRGSSVFLTPDMLEKLQAEAGLVQVNAMQFLQQPSPDVLRQFGRSIHSYLGIPSWPVFVSNRDPTLTEYLSTKPASNTAAHVATHTGGIPVPPERYMEVIAAMQPDMFVALADEVTGDAKPKRVKLSVDRTINWLDECIRLQEQQQQQQEEQEQQHQQQPEQQHTNNRAQLDQQQVAAVVPALFAPVVGGASEAERVRSAAAAAERDNVAGFALCGFGMGEHYASRPKLLSAALQQLPADKPKVAVGLDTPEDVLSAVSQGVDLFDCSYPLQATANGYALCFPLSPEQPLHQQQQQQQDASAAAAAAEAAVLAASNPFGAAAGPKEGSSTAPATAAATVDPDAGAGADDSKLNLWALSYRLDKGPLVRGCSCFTCQHHSRAYIHHLLHTHEMLAGVLLEMHNTHWWLGFFAAIREAIQAGRLQEYRGWFNSRRAQLQQQQGQVGQSEPQPT